MPDISKVTFHPCNTKRKESPSDLAVWYAYTSASIG